jgi:hypothetical protein
MDEPTASGIHLEIQERDLLAEIFQNIPFPQRIARIHPTYLPFTGATRIAD